MCVYSSLLSPLEYIVYSFISSGVILKEKNYMALRSGMVFVFNLLYKGQPLFVLKL